MIDAKVPPTSARACFGVTKVGAGAMGGVRVEDKERTDDKRLDTKREDDDTNDVLLGAKHRGGRSRQGPWRCGALLEFGMRL
jgi:hypothetical protein